jgi:hypothetical protein
MTDELRGEGLPGEPGALGTDGGGQGGTGGRGGRGGAWGTTDNARRRIDWDVRGILAIMSLVGAFALATGLMVQGLSPEIPAWAAAVVSGVMGFYFGSRGGGDAR